MRIISKFCWHKYVRRSSIFFKNHKKCRDAESTIRIVLEYKQEFTSQILLSIKTYFLKSYNY